MIPPLSTSGQLLWRLLPRLYRERDGRGGIDPKRPTGPIEERGDLANYLDAFGHLLDQLRGTLEARLLDVSPETCQPWLIPYFADLIDVRLVSPDVEGQREEVARAVSWRQRKGTLGALAEIAERVGRLERVVLIDSAATHPSARFGARPTVVVQEGFRRVVTTVSIGAPLATPSQLGRIEPFPASGSPIEAAKNPALPAGTVDFRALSRARKTSDETLSARENAFTRAPGGSASASGDERPYGVQVRWYQQHPHGVPCHVDTYQDASVRTVDMRTPSHGTGLYHPRRLLLWAEPRTGFSNPQAVVLAFDGLQALLAGDPDARSETIDTLEGLVTESVHFAPGGTAPSVPGFCMLERDVLARDGRRLRTRVAGLLAEAAPNHQPARTEMLSNTAYPLVAGVEIVEAYASRVAPHPSRRTLRGFGEEHPLLVAEAGFALEDLGASGVHALEDVTVRGTLTVPSRGVELLRSAVERVDVAPAAAGTPVSETSPAVSAVDCLFGEVAGAGATCRFDYCTIVWRFQCARLQASDSILLGASAASFEKLWLRYCCVPWLPEGPLDPDRGRAFEPSITRDVPLFLDAVFGRAGAGVLHPACARAVREGAEDGGELGAFHHRHHVRREQALLDKLREFLPVTLEPVLIPHRPWIIPIASTPQASP